ncbi:2-phosphosulfolactate phosphatase [Herbiconiux sp. 11R-BC]|uniref:2-phosphosulfolactate phosphatase n=1 Tax=Herbiconiux sp. 11R-BC TaxID=3111637 RepID=UPI003C02389C
MPSSAESAAVVPQSRYQVRLLVGAGVTEVRAAVSSSDVVVVVDVLDDGDLARFGEQEAFGAIAPVGAGAEVVVADFRTRTAAAQVVLDAQARFGTRAHVTVVTLSRADGRFAVEDFLAAGAVVDALAELGLDFSSPEAAAACAAFTGLRRAIGHLVSASVAGQEWVSLGRADALAEAARLDAVDTVLSVS